MELVTISLKGIVMVVWSTLVHTTMKKTLKASRHQQKHAFFDYEQHY